MKKTLRISFMGLLFIALLTACGGGKAVKSDSEQSLNENPIDGKYNVALLQKVEIDPQVEADYPTAVADYENNLLSELRTKNHFREVDKQSTSSRNKGNVLLIKSKVLSMRVVSGSSRFWFGAAAGTSDMSLEIKLIDSKTGNLLREKVLSTANNPFGAVFVGGSSDKSLPADMGKIVAAYIMAVTRGK